MWVINALSPQEIRDRLLGPNSVFRDKLARYLESAHRAEYFHGSRDAVITKRKVEPLPLDADSDEEIDLSSDYRPPTQTLPRAPPLPCVSKKCAHQCLDCIRRKKWWRNYRLQVDDLLVRSNVHTHFLSVEHQRAEDEKLKWRRSKRNKKEPNFKIRRERKGCLTRTGVCRARFPRDVFAVTEMAEDGHINVRHVEPMMNKVNPVLTYLNRCNSDVSSLLSGTAVKAVVSYVTDYISKLSLKSYQMFASVYDVFDKESELIGGSVRDKDNARHMMRKMVNSMSAKMEIGSPMASLYLLGNPDHYASHDYVPFAWRQYVQFVRAFWIQELKEEEEEEGEDEEDDLFGQGDDEERLPVGRTDGKFVPASSVDDYRFRPLEADSLNLYEWVQCHKKKKRTMKQRDHFEDNLLQDATAKAMRSSRHSKVIYNEEYPISDEEMLEDEPPDEEDEDATGKLGPSESNSVADGESDWETDDEEEVILGKQANKDKEKKPVQHAFLEDHPLYLSHSVSCDPENIYKIIPNFIGGAVPRSDKGDRAAYCMTMLTLFKPWRSPMDLKDRLSTWDQAFKEHNFGERQMELIKNFDVRYECNDARDDHFAQMKQK
ncbi:hypothetical protein B0H16DRAFT_1308832, partial [Mycena metata]